MVSRQVGVEWSHRRRHWWGVVAGVGHVNHAGWGWLHHCQRQWWGGGHIIVVVDAGGGCCHWTLIVLVIIAGIAIIVG